MFYIKNYIDWNQFNEFYNLDQMNKGIKNTKVVVRKLRLGLIRATNHKLKFANKKSKKEKKK